MKLLKKTTPKQRISRLRKILTRIKENPDCWNQHIMHMGQEHCFAGVADCYALGGSKHLNFQAAFVGKNLVTDNFHVTRNSGNVVLRSTLTELEPWESAREWLGLTCEEAIDLFNIRIDTLQDLEEIVEETIKNTYLACE